MPGQYKCPCGADLSTLKELHSHQLQSQDCQAWATRAKRAVSTSSSEDKVLKGPTHLITPPVEPMQLSDNDSELNNINISSPLPPDPSTIHDSDEEPMPTLEASSQKCPHDHVEDMKKDELPEADLVYIQEFLANFHAGWKKREVKTQFEILREKQRAEGQEPWFPFPSEDEWELTQWLMESAASQSKIDSFLKLKVVCVSPVMAIT
jgi:hypothetical protein